jgi:hypothetical protein
MQTGQSKTAGGARILGFPLEGLGFSASLLLGVVSFFGTLWIRGRRLAQR